MQNYEILAIKREWVPEGLYWFLCQVARPVLVHQPFRWLLHRAPRGQISSVKCPHCKGWFDPFEPQAWEDPNR